MVSAHLQDEGGNGGMEVHVVMSVDVVEREARPLEGLKLGKDFRFQLISYPGPEKKVASSADKVR